MTRLHQREALRYALMITILTILWLGSAYLYVDHAISTEIHRGDPISPSCQYHVICP